MTTLNRNDPCHCGSGKKFKTCHGAGKEKRRGIPAWLFFVVLALLAGAGLYYKNSVAGDPPAPSIQDMPSAIMRFENVPGFPLTDVSANQKKVFLDRVNRESCSCGCVGDTVAKCVVQDPSCQVAPAMAARILAEVRASEK